MTKAVLLDVLGTLCYLDSPGERLHAELAARGVEVDPDAARRASDAEIAYYLAHLMDGDSHAGLDDLHDRCADVIRTELELDSELHAPVLDAMRDALVFLPFPDAVPALERLRAEGLTLVAASNWDISLPRALERMGLAALLDGAVSSVLAGALKPEPSVFLTALSKAGCEPGEAVFVGDSVENDIEGARRVGLRAILVQRFGDPPPGIEVVRSLEDLASVI